MKKTIVSLIISVIFTLSALGAITFFTRLQTSKEKEKYREIANSIALNVSGQGLSMPFIPKSEEIRFVTYAAPNNKACTLYVILILPENKHAVYSYPCQVQDNIIYSVGLEYANYSTYCLTEYIIMGVFAFLLCFSITCAVKFKK